MDLDFIMEKRKELLRITSTGKIKMEGSVVPGFSAIPDMVNSTAEGKKKWKSVEEADPPEGFTGILPSGEKWRDCPYYARHKYLLVRKIHLFP